MQCQLLFNIKLEEFTSKHWVSKHLVSDFKKIILVVLFWNTVRWKWWVLLFTLFKSFKLFPVSQNPYLWSKWLVFTFIYLKNSCQKYFSINVKFKATYSIKFFNIFLYLLVKMKPDTKELFKTVWAKGLKTERKVTVPDIGFKIKDKRRKSKNLKLFTSIDPNSKVKPQKSLECSNSSI